MKNEYIDLDVQLVKKIINKYDCYNKGDGDYYEIKIKNVDESFVDLTENICSTLPIKS